MYDQPTLDIMPSVRLCRVHLLRHAPTEQGSTRICRGHQDVPLSAEGRRRSLALAHWYLAKFGSPAVIYSSDLSRCRFLAEQLGTPTLLPGLREQDMGAWEGQSWESLTRADPVAVDAWWRDWVDSRPPRGESWRQMYQRVVSTWEAQPPAPQVVVVGHAGTLRALLCHWFGMGPEQGLRWAPPQASFTQVLLADAGPVLEAFGVDQFPG
jgi:alpha-ribazole phosphatase